MTTLADDQYEMLTMDNVLERIEMCGPHVLLKQYPERETAVEGGKVLLPDSAKEKSGFHWIIGLSDQAQAEGFALKQSVLAPFHALNDFSRQLGKGICYIHMQDLVARDKTMTVERAPTAVDRPMEGYIAKYLPLGPVAARLGLSKAYLRQLVEQKVIPALSANGRLLCEAGAVGEALGKLARTDIDLSLSDQTPVKNEGKRKDT